MHLQKRTATEVKLTTTADVKFELFVAINAESATNSYPVSVENCIYSVNNYIDGSTTPR